MSSQQAQTGSGATVHWDWNVSGIFNIMYYCGVLNLLNFTIWQIPKYTHAIVN